MKDINYRFSIEQINHYPYHANKNLRLLYAMKGEIKIGYIVGELILKQDDIEFCNINEPTEITAITKDNIVIILEINYSYLMKTIPTLENIILNVFGALFFPKWQRNFTSQNIKSKDELINLFFNLFNETNSNTSPDILDQNLELLCRFSMENFNDRKKHLSCLPNISESMVERFLRIDNYMKNNSKQKITLKDLATAEHLSPQYLSAEFSSKYSRTFGNILELYRVKEAIKLIINEDIKISQICEICGFSDMKYFYRAFKKYFGYTPAELKKNILLDSSVTTQFIDLNSKDFQDCLLKQKLSKNIAAETAKKFNLISCNDGYFMSKYTSGTSMIQQLVLISVEFREEILIERDELWIYYTGDILEITDKCSGEKYYLGNEREDKTVLSIYVNKGSVISCRVISSIGHVVFSRIHSCS